MRSLKGDPGFWRQPSLPVVQNCCDILAILAMVYSNGMLCTVSVKKGRTATTTMPRVFWCLAYLYLNTSNQVQPRNKLQNLSHAALLAKFHRAGNLQERHFLQAVVRRSVAYGHAVAAEESSPLLLCSNRGAIGSFLLPCQENSRLNKSCPAKVLLYQLLSLCVYVPQASKHMCNIVLARHAAKIL